MNKLHVILGLVHMKRYDRLENYIRQAAPAAAGAVADEITG
ncbi:Spo0B domain-containing protein, partial [Erwinia amylovora]